MGLVLCEGDVFVLMVDDWINCIVSVVFVFGFLFVFENVGILGLDMISVGDVFGLMIWENVDDGFLVL